MSFSPPEGNGPLLRERLRTARLYFVCDARPNGADPEPLLRAALVKEPESADAYEQLAMAYGHKNDLPDADLASAQAAFARGDNKTARELAARAKTRFPVGSPGWVRADDIVAFNKSMKRNPLFQ